MAGPAQHYPEANGLVALRDCDARSGTPSCKSIPVLLSISTGDCVPDAAAATWQQGDVHNDLTGAQVAGAQAHRPNGGTTSK